MAKSSPAVYQIRIEGHLSAEWSHWFHDFNISVDNGSAVTTLTGAIIDQAELRGIANKIWDLNLAILSIQQIHGNSSPEEQNLPSLQPPD